MEIGVGENKTNWKSQEMEKSRNVQSGNTLKSRKFKINESVFRSGA